MRRLWITLTDTLRKIYLDEDKNLQFKDYFLEEITHSRNADNSEKTLSNILEKLFEKKQNNPKFRENLRKIHDREIFKQGVKRTAVDRRI